MYVQLQPGLYVVAVSGGVDSMVLLDMLRQLPDVKLVVAHYDHGIRDDAYEDRRIVQRVADSYGLPFIYDSGELGAGASEAAARLARYNFLHQVRRASGARAIVTAHHQDDVLETAILNMLRGTGRKGLTSLNNASDIVRPLLSIPKWELVDYATQHGLGWREDSTNSDQSYARNYVRHQIVPRLGSTGRKQLLAIINHLLETNEQLDTLLVNYLHFEAEAKKLHRASFTLLPHAVSKEIMASWLRANGQRSFDAKTLERLTVAAKTGQSGTIANVAQGVYMQIGKNNLALATIER